MTLATFRSDGRAPGVGVVIADAARIVDLQHGYRLAWPGYSNVRDFELEFAMFLKGLAKDIRNDGAAKSIFGYTVSAASVERR